MTVWLKLVKAQQKLSRTSGCNIRDQVVPVLLLLQTTESHLGSGDVLLGVLKVLELHSNPISKLPRLGISEHDGIKLTRESSFQTTPFCLLASVYWKPSTWPDLRPKRPWRFGPTLLEPPASRVWHWAQRVLNKFAPLESEPSGGTR